MPIRVIDIKDIPDELVSPKNKTEISEFFKKVKSCTGLESLDGNSILFLYLLSKLEGLENAKH